MSVEFFAIGGFNEVGKNMAAVKIDEEVIILDMGLYIPRLLDIEEENKVKEFLTRERLIKLGAVPDDSLLDQYKNNVKAILIGHCHLDHSGAAPYLASRYNCPIFGSPFTIEVLKNTLKDNHLKLNNQLRVINPGSGFRISKDISAEFINITHSTLQTVVVAIHTKHGIIVYANDFKLDNHPVLGKKPDYDRLRELGQTKKVIALICDALYAGDEKKTPSEKVAREMLSDVLLGIDNKGHAVIVTTFASHIARLKSIVDLGLELNRKVVFMGRSLKKYVSAAEHLNLVNFKGKIKLFAYRNQIKKALKIVEKNRGKYLVVCTGNQGEPNSALVRIANGEYMFKFIPEDQVIFSSRTIPVKENLENRAKLESNLKNKKVRIFKEIHVSGHAAKEDLRDFIDMIRPKHIIPIQGTLDILNNLANLAEEMGYKKSENVHLLKDSDIVSLY
ncbi:RNase J family beta-CASP ribonuclease [Candidatus Woesearchaeota archaeon]|nr:RNase J family beta-CASP ribonuclease [Candidatus Woesearchaeota archaeon]